MLAIMLLSILSSSIVKAENYDSGGILVRDLFNHDYEGAYSFISNNPYCEITVWGNRGFKFKFNGSNGTEWLLSKKFNHDIETFVEKDKNGFIDYVMLCTESVEYNYALPLFEMYYDFFLRTGLPDFEDGRSVWKNIPGFTYSLYYDKGYYSTTKKAWTWSMNLIIRKK